MDVETLEKANKLARELREKNNELKPYRESKKHTVVIFKTNYSGDTICLTLEKEQVEMIKSVALAAAKKNIEDLTEKFKQI